MTGKEIVRLINRLEKEGMSDAKILDIILDIIKEVNDPELKNAADNNKVNLINGLKEIGLTDSQIVDFIEFVESSDPKILERIRKTDNNNNNDK